MNKKDPALQDEIVFIAYDDVIKSTKFAVLKKLITDKELREEYEDRIDFSKIDKMSDGELLAFIITSMTKDILEDVAIKEFDYFKEYISITLRYPDIIHEGFPLKFATAIQILLQQKFTKKIYIYFKYNDQRVFEELQSMYGKNKDKIYFVTGELTDVIKNLEDKITLYVFNDVDMINSVVETGNIENSQIMVAEYGYNYVEDKELNIGIWKIKEDEEFQKNNNCILKVFFPSNDAKFN